MAIEWNPILFPALAAGIALGAVVVHLLHRRAGASDRERAEQLAADLEETREELESRREEVARHFEQTSHLFRDLTEQYSRLYAHLAEGAREFCTDEIPALAGFEPPLLGGESEASGEAEAAEPKPPAETSDPKRANGGSHPDAGVI